MAADLDLLKSFVDGQGAGAQTYVTYAEDHDTNYQEIESQFNALNAEVRAFAGNNATLVLDLLLPNDPVIATGIVGLDSFAPIAFITGDTQIQVPRGVAITTISGRVRSTLDPATLTGSGVSGSRFINMDADGTVTLETATLQGAIDLYSVNWNGSTFDTGTLTRLEEVLVDADDFQNQRIQEDFGQGSDTVIPSFTYDQIAQRINDIVRIMGAELVSSAVATPGGPAAPTLAPMAFGGTGALPGFILGDGATYENTSGLFGTPGVGSFGFSVLATTLATLAETAANEPQMRFRNGTTLADPPISFSDDDNGLGFVSADVWRLIAGALEAARLSNVAGVVSLAFVGDPDTGSNPGLAVIGDLDTGLLSETADNIQVMTGGTTGLRQDVNQQVDNDLQFRFDVTTSAEARASGVAYVPISMDAEVTDVGGWGAAPDSTWVVPTGGAGFYQINGYILFDESTSATPNAGDQRAVSIQIDGTIVAEDRDEPNGTSGVDHAASVSRGMELAAGASITLEAFQNSGNSMDLDGRLSAVKLW